MHVVVFIYAVHYKFVSSHVAASAIYYRFSAKEVFADDGYPFVGIVAFARSHGYIRRIVEIAV